MNKTLGEVSICGFTDVGEKICSAGGRISTLPGNAKDILAKSGDPEKNTKLIGKVTASGHNSITEHAFFNLCFCDVSVLVEQFMIEFRLASFTVKSRRYVDFSDAGYYVPEFKNEKSEKIFKENTDNLFKTYSRLLELGAAKEDARFVLPYCFRSNFFCSLNARELTNVLHAMLYGRGKRYPEIYALGKSLAVQAAEKAPGIFAGIFEGKDIKDTLDLSDVIAAGASSFKQDEAVELLSYTPHAEKTAAKAAVINATGLSDAMAQNIVNDKTKRKEIIKRVLACSRPRELEHISFTFRLNDLSLASITHLVRHRIHSVNIPELKKVKKDKFIVPPALTGAAKKIYLKAFEDNFITYNTLREMGEDEETLAYLDLAGNTLDVVSTMNGRQLLLFFKLRTCNRAQWEIRDYAVKMLEKTREVAPDIFNAFGPSCFVTGHCPEGRLTCGKMAEIKEKFKAE